MAVQKHIIKKQVLEVDLPSADNAWLIQNRVCDLYKQELVPVLENVFDELCPMGETISIDKLEIDLGSLTIESLEEEIRKKLRIYLRDKFTPAVLRAKSEAAAIYGKNGIMGISTSISGPDEEIKVNVKPRFVTAAALVIHFLRTGTLPWWYDRETYGTPVAALQELTKGTSPYFTEQLKEFTRLDFVRARLMYSLRDEELQELLLLFAESTSRELVQGFFEAAKKSDRLSSSNMPAASFRKLVWNSAMRYIITGESEAPAELLVFMLPFLIKNEGAEQVLSAETVRMFSGLFTELRSHVMERVRVSGPLNAKELIHTLEKEQLQEKADGQKNRPGLVKEKEQKNEQENNEGQEKGPDRSALTDLLQEIKKQTDEQPGEQIDTAGKTRIEKKKKEEEKERSKERARQSLKKKRKLAERKVEGNDTQIENENSEAEEFPAAEDKKKILPGIDPEDLADFYIGNSGLVLLWPFLNTFFTELGLVKEKKFIDEAAAHHAVHLLQHLAFADETEYDEADLVLNKIVCGLDITEPIDMHFIISEAEKTECENLLNSVIENWKAIGKISLNGFRTTFLQKEGAFKKAEKGWNLFIERKTVDMLLDRLPWGFGIVKLPWSKEIVYTEW
jgi:hypothetical protein